MDKKVVVIHTNTNSSDLKKVNEDHSPVLNPSNAFEVPAV